MTLANLHQQARLQVEADTLAVPPYELLPLESERGFARLPDPSPGDVMFDLEGDPLWTPARELTFLFGLLLAEGDGWRYEPIWGHSIEEEREAFQRVVDLLMARLEAHPDMHVYHYSPAEPGALTRLMAAHATRELEIDELLRRKVFVDLLTVVRQSMRVGVESYSLKQIEVLAGFRRSADMGSGADAVLGYERYIEHGRPRRAGRDRAATTTRTAGPRWRCATGSSRCGLPMPIGCRRCRTRTSPRRPPRRRPPARRCAWSS